VQTLSAMREKQQLRFEGTLAVAQTFRSLWNMYKITLAYFLPTNALCFLSAIREISLRY